MKKDFQIPLVSGVEIAMVYEYNELYKTDDWNVYIINNNNVDMEMIVIVSQGFSKTKKSTLLRKKLDTLPANSFAKVEFVQPELFVLNNRFQVSFFENNQLKDKTYLLKKSFSRLSHLPQDS